MYLEMGLTKAFPWAAHWSLQGAGSPAPQLSLRVLHSKARAISGFTVTQSCELPHWAREKKKCSLKTKPPQES